MSTMHTSRPLRGILAMLIAVAMFSMMDVAMKHLVEAYPPMQVTFLRGLASLPFLLGAAAVMRRWRDLVPVRWGLHAVRGALSVATLWCFVYAVSILSLGDAYAIFMSAPLLITALSVPMLKEHVGWRRWTAVFIGMIGVIVVLKPGPGSLVTLGGLAAFAGALGYALNALTIRVLSKTDTAAATVLWSLVLLTAMSALLALPGWVSIRWEHLGWIVGLGLTGALGQHFITEAFRRAPPPVIAPLEFTALAWGMLFDWVFWATQPGIRMLTGATIIVMSGIYVFRREHQLARSTGNS